MHPITKFLLRKILFYTATFIIMLVITFVLPRAIPGNAVLMQLRQFMRTAATNPEAIEERYRALLSYFGLDKPLWEQFVDYLWRVAHGDLGVSITFFPKRVSDLIFSSLPWSLALLVPAYTASWFVGNVLGTYAAHRRNTAIDNALFSTFVVLSQVPYFIFGFFLLATFAVQMRIFPTYGGWDVGLVPSLTWDFIRSYLHHYALPFLSIFLTGIGVWGTGARTMAIYEFGSDYMEYADSMGVPESRLLRYAFKNILVPQITGFSMQLGFAVGGALLTEIVFSYPGVGWLLYRGTITQDYMLIQGSFIVVASSVLLANFITDILYAVIDPRIRKGYVSA
ncbi:MAG: ABC transporter permease [Thermoprotei archaeon]|nr:MAG: ABC transporter permease [Thermoprotei archaeon]